jgi:hypothetical protein
MRMPRKYGFSLGTRMSMHDTTFYVVLWAQPFHRWLVAFIYHKYDTWVCRLPGFSRVDRWWQRRDPQDVPLSCHQDIRCYDLRNRGRVELAELTLDPETHERVREFKYPTRRVVKP